MSELDRFSKLKFTYSKENKPQNLKSESNIRDAALKILALLKRWRLLRTKFIEQYSTKIITA